MSAPETRKPGPAAPEPRAHEPSMEEILASIRRIIADDQATPSRGQRDEDAQFRSELDMSPPVQDARTATASLESQRPERPPFLRGSTDNSAMVFRHPAAPADHPSSGPTNARPVAPQGPIGHIAAPQFAMPDMPRPASPAGHDPDIEAALPHVKAPVAADSASDDSAPTMTAGAHHEDPSEEAALFSAATDESVTAAFNRLAAIRLVENDAMLKDMVREMLRPLLRDWLDDNLPSMVERLVRAEIERVGRGGR